MNFKLTDVEAFNAMRLFLEKYYEQTGSDHVGSLLGDMQFIGEDRNTADSAAWYDWINCINQVLEEKNKKP